MAASSFPPSVACGVGPSGVSSAPPPPARAPPAADAAKVAVSGALSFKDAASRRKETSHHPAAVPEAPAITVQLPKDTLEIASELSKTALVAGSMDSGQAWQTSAPGSPLLGPWALLVAPMPRVFS